MAYSKFEESIVTVHKVTIEGWPDDVPRVSPQSLTKAEDVKELYDAWTEGQTAWRKLTTKEVRDLKSLRDPAVARVKNTEKSQGKRKRVRAEGLDEAHASADETVSRKKKKGPSKQDRNTSGDKQKVKRTSKPGKKKEVDKSSNVTRETLVKTRAPIARKAKGKGKALLDGIEDENEGESDAYVEDEE